MCINAFPRTRDINLSLDDAVNRLKEWLKFIAKLDSNQRPVQLNGNIRGQNDSSQWLVFSVTGFETKPFTSEDGQTFRSEDYNGVVNFHGDAKLQALQAFVRGFERTNGNLSDFLHASATLHKKDKPSRPKFGLKGFTEGGVNGFYLYHDNWQPRNN